MTIIVKWTLDQSGIDLLKNKLDTFWTDWTDLGQQDSGWSLAARMNQADTWLKYKPIGDGLYQTYLTLPEGTELVVTNLLPLLGPGEIRIVGMDETCPVSPQALFDQKAKTLGDETIITKPAPRMTERSFIARVKAFLGFGDKL